MTTANRAPRVTTQADALLRRAGLLRNPYFRDLCDGGMSLEGFRRSQEQFFFAVTFFPRPMAALLGRLPHPRQRLEILHNLVEEHGEFEETRFHHNTFQQFLHTIGGRPEFLDSLPVAPALRAFNAVLTSACVLDELEVGVACLGIIEHAFAEISALIGKAVVERGWLRPGELVHYTLHAEIDARHAEGFFALVEPAWDDPARRYYIEQGLELGAYVFDRLYRDLHALSEASAHGDALSQQSR
ncbi:MAG: TenA family transcriptional regulator [Gemmataceae bacterium]